jgi:hypothetical protein
MAAIPGLKVAVLLIKQATKPLTRALKARTQSNELFGNMCGFLGQQWHRQTTRLNLMVQGHRVKGVKPLNDEEAKQSGAELLSEGFVLTVGLSALILETQRSARANAAKVAQKEARRVAKMTDLERRFKIIQDEFEEMGTVVKALYAHIDGLERAYKKGQQHLPLPPLPASLQKVPGLPPSLHVPAKREEPESVWKTVVPHVSMNGISYFIRWAGAAINGEEMEEDDDAGEGDEDHGAGSG